MIRADRADEDTDNDAEPETPIDLFKRTKSELHGTLTTLPMCGASQALAGGVVRQSQNTFKQLGQHFGECIKVLITATLRTACSCHAQRNVSSFGQTSLTVEASCATFCTSCINLQNVIETSTFPQ